MLSDPKNIKKPPGSFDNLELNCTFEKLFITIYEKNEI